MNPVTSFLNDEHVTEIMINGTGPVYIERSGTIEGTNFHFKNEEELMGFIDELCRSANREPLGNAPYMDIRLENGARVNIVSPSVSLTGPLVTIRKPAKAPVTMNELLRQGSLSRQAAEFLKLCVLLKRNIVIAGGTGSGKTTLLNVLASHIPEYERIITIEDIAELMLSHNHVCSLETRAPQGTAAAVTVRDLFKNSLRMRPNRIIIGECRGGEALDMLQAMSCGHYGSMTTLHATSARDSLRRLEVMVLMSGVELPLCSIRELIASSLHILVQVERENTGKRRITAISEITGMEGSMVTLSPVFELRDDRGAPAELAASGIISNTLETARQKGLVLIDILTDEKKRRPSLMEDDTGQGTVEYALIALVLILVAGAALHLFRGALASSFVRTASARSGLRGVLP
jgi:pilus assembly protein CpaF